MNTEQNNETAASLRPLGILAVLPLFILFIIPLAETVAINIFHVPIEGANDYIRHTVLAATFIGGIIASLKKNHLGFTIASDILPERARSIASLIILILSSSLLVAFTVNSVSFIIQVFPHGEKIGKIPAVLVLSVMPVGFFIMAAANLLHVPRGWKRFLLAGAALLLGIWMSSPAVPKIIESAGGNSPDIFHSIGDSFYAFSETYKWGIIILLILSGVFGMPLFLVLGGLGYVLFAGQWDVLELIANEGYKTLIDSNIPAIPLFTLTGYILSESKSGQRLIDLFTNFFGWLPGGLAIMAILICTFFTTFTGASGVTILALGGLLSFVLVNSGRYSEKFSHGLLTSSGSIGLLFPPSLPIILYGVVAQVNIKHMFFGGIIPGILIVMVLVISSVFVSVRQKNVRTRFEFRKAMISLFKASGEVALPVLILVFYFNGITSIIETAALAVLYAVILETVIHRDLSLSGLFRVFLKSLPVIGGILVILASAKGLSYYIIDTDLPYRFTEWVGNTIHSKFLFLLLLNIALLVTGCFMDIFSATMVVVPLITPLGEIFGIHPVHLGIIFLANLELGYLTPPVGLNLFLAAYRFEEPLGKVYRQIIPFFLLLLVAVLLITYVPWFSTALVP